MNFNTRGIQNLVSLVLAFAIWNLNVYRYQVSQVKSDRGVLRGGGAMGPSRSVHGFRGVVGVQQKLSRP